MKRGWKIALGAVGLLVVLGAGGMGWMLVQAPKPAKKKAAPALPDKAQAILAALPALAAGDTLELRVATGPLRDAGLLSRSGSSTKLFGQFPELFELIPDKQPNHVKRRA